MLRRLKKFFKLMGDLNAEASGSEPVEVFEELGTLSVPSGALSIGDAICFAMIDIEGITVGSVTISAALLRYPDGLERVKSIRISVGTPALVAERRKLGSIAVDSARIVVADRAAFLDHWTDIGPDRIGIISTAPDDTVRRLLTERFRLRTVPVDGIRAEVVGPVSETLEAEIEAFLKGPPVNAEYPFLHFRVQTNNTHDRMTHVADAWAFMAIGSSPSPRMLTCDSGWGDGTYDVIGHFENSVLRVVTVNFMDDA